MQLECTKHSELLSFFCSSPSCQTYLCKDCCSNHASHEILDARGFADYVLKEIKKRQNEVNLTLLDIEGAERFGKPMIRTYVRQITETTTKLLSYMKGISESIVKRSLNTLECILQSMDPSAKAIDVALATQEKDRLQEIKTELIMAKESEHFFAVQQTWEKLKLKEEEKNAKDSPNSLYSMMSMFEEIKKFADGLTKKLSEISDQAYNSLNELKRSSLIDNMQSTPEVCSTCEHKKEIYLIQPCAHGICFECSQKEICERTLSKGLKVIDTEFECKDCGFEGSASQIMHQGCGCMINTKKHKEIASSPYFWDSNTGKFQWPMCRHGKALNQEDIFFIYGGSAFTFLDDFLPLEKFVDIVQPNDKYKYMTLCRDLHKEDVQDIRNIMTNTEIEHVIWRGQRLQILIEGMITGLENVKKLQTVNFSTNSLGDCGIKQLLQVNGALNRIKMLDLCKN